LKVTKGAKQNKAKHLQAEREHGTLGKWKKPDGNGRLASREWLCYSLKVARSAKQNKAKHLQAKRERDTLRKSQAASLNNGHGLQKQSGCATL
jgi:hypothetical protein